VAVVGGSGEEDLMKAVREYRTDPYSCTADAASSALKWLKAKKTAVTSWPIVLAMLLAGARMSIVGDYGSDANVGLTLRQAGNPIWGTIVLSLMTLPYIALTAVLANYASKRLADRGCPRAVSKAVWVVTGVPFLLVADLYLNIRYMFTNPKSTSTYHYLHLRKITELIEALPQVLLQAYIGLRMWNPWDMFPQVRGASVNPVALLMSLLLSAMSIYDAETFVTKFARRQSGGDWRAFIGKMVHLGEGLAPSGIYEAMDKQRVAVCDFDLSGVRVREIQSLGRTVRASEAIQEVHFTDARFLDVLRNHHEFQLQSFIQDLLSCPGLVSLLFGKGAVDATYEAIKDRVKVVMGWAHPSLRSVYVEGHPDIVPDRTLVQELPLACSQGDVEALRACLLRAGPAEAASAPIDEKGNRPLHLAVRWRQPAAVSMLLAARGDPNLKENGGASPVYVAAAVNSAEALTPLFAARGDPNLQQNDGVSAVWMAAQNNSAEALTLRLAARGNPNLRRNAGVSPVRIATQLSSEEALRFLLAAGGE